MTGTYLNQKLSYYAKELKLLKKNKSEDVELQKKYKESCEYIHALTSEMFVNILSFSEIKKTLNKAIEDIELCLDDAQVDSMTRETIINCLDSLVLEVDSNDF